MPTVRREIPIVLDNSDKHATLIEVHVNGPSGAIHGTKLVDGKLVGVPVGGPYTVTCRIAVDNRTVTMTAGPIFVGDLWVLAGQSNMEGVGDLIDVTPPHPRVSLLGMDGKWAPGRGALALAGRLAGPCSLGRPQDAHRAIDARRTRARSKGAGLGLPFAVALVEATGVPIGLVACARRHKHGAVEPGPKNRAARVSMGRCCGK